MGSVMGTQQGVQVSAFADLGDAPEVDCTTYPCGTVELTIGGSEGFDLVTTEAGLATLVVGCEDALRSVRERMASQDDG